MILKDNSKAKTKSIYLLSISIILLLVSIIIFVLDKMMHGGTQSATSASGLTNFYLVYCILPIFCFAYIVFKLHNITDNNIDNILSAYSFYFVVQAICFVLNSASAIIYEDLPLIIFGIIAIMFATSIHCLLPILGIHKLKIYGITSFFKKALVFEIILSAISTISSIFALVHNLDYETIVGMFSVVAELLVYVSIYLLVKDIVTFEKEMQLKDLTEVNISKNVILTIITVGVYGIVWLYTIAKTIKIINNDKSSCTGEIICIILVPFYMIYWIFTRSKIIKSHADNKNLIIGDNAALYLLLSLFGLTIVSVALMQNDLNTITKNKYTDLTTNASENYSKNSITDI